MIEMAPLHVFADINPRVALSKGAEYPFVDMEQVKPRNRYVSARANKLFNGGGTKFCSGDTLFARITPCLENGKIGQYIDAVRKEAFGSTEFIVLRARPQVSDSSYLFYLVNSDIVRKPAEMSMFGASGRQRADLAIVRKVLVPAPPLPTQRKIAAILSAYDDLIENNQRRIAILEEMARNLYREWFVDFRFPGHEHVPLVESELGPVPEGWAIIELGSIAVEVRRSIAPNQIDPQTPYVGLEHIPRKSITLSDWGAASEVASTKLIFSKGDILFGKIRPYFHKVCVAPIDGVCSSDTIVIAPREQSQFGLVLACTSSEAFVEHATATSQGTKMPRASWNVMSRYRVAVPPITELSMFDMQVRALVHQTQNFAFRNQNLRRTRDLLLPKLVSGELDVANLDIDGGRRETDS